MPLAKVLKFSDVVGEMSVSVAPSNSREHRPPPKATNYMSFFATRALNISSGPSVECTFVLQHDVSLSV